jgi:hypothetical protein
VATGFSRRPDVAGYQGHSDRLPSQRGLCLVSPSPSWGCLLYREYRSVQLQNAIDDVAANIESNRAANQENLRMSREFAAIQKPIEEVVRFHNVPITPDHLLTELIAMQPDAVILESVNFSGGTEGKGKNKSTFYTLILSGTINHTLDDPAPQAISDYRTSLEELPVLVPYFMESELSGFTRNDALGVFNFTIRLKLNETPGKAAT